MQNIGHREQLQSSIVKTLLYFDIFSYPLTPGEILQKLSTNHTCLEEVRDVLDSMKTAGVVFQLDEYFAVRNELALAQRRDFGNQRARKILPRALRRGRLLYKFPFIRSVMISGSLSKNYMDEDSDVDYFVITSPGRLWVSRFFVALFKRVFLFNSKRLFCVNYYIDSRNLEIHEKNIFTATELASLIPVCGKEYHSKLIEENSWITTYFPNHGSVPLDSKADRDPMIRNLLEVFINPVGDWLDSYTHRIASRRYARLYGHLFTQEDFKIAFKSKKDVSKNHDKHFQKHITELYARKVETFVREHPQYSLS